MKGIKLTESQYGKFLEYKKFNLEAIATDCQTPDAIFHINITDSNIDIKIDLPQPLNLDEKEAELLEANIHNLLEIGLQKYFPEKNQDI